MKKIRLILIIFLIVIVNINASGDIYIPEEQRPVMDVDPIYMVYKNGYFVEVPIELQWTIRIMAQGHNYPEKILYGVILTESTFNPNTISSNGKWHGLFQISRGWIQSNPLLSPYRINEFYNERNLYDPCQNLITFFELQNYARSTYDLDPWNEDDLIRLLNWHSSGNFSESTWKNSTTKDYFKFTEELIEIDYSIPIWLEEWMVQ